MIVDFWNSDFLKKSQLDLPSAWIFFFTFFFAWIFFLGIFPCMNFFWGFFPTLPPLPDFSNGPSLRNSYLSWQTRIDNRSVEEDYSFLTKYMTQKCFWEIWEKSWILSDLLGLGCIVLIYMLDVTTALSFSIKTAFCCLCIYKLMKVNSKGSWIA